MTRLEKVFDKKGSKNKVLVTYTVAGDPSLTSSKKILNDCKQEGNDLRITVQDGAGKIPSFVNELTANNIEIEAVSASKPTLDDVFLKVTGYRLEGSETLTKSEEAIGENQ